MQGLVQLVDPEHGRAPRPGRVLLGLVVFVVALLGAASLLRALAPPYLDSPEIQRKLDHFAANSHRYDTLFIGSSYVWRGVMPSLFDAITREAGVPTRSFNFGVPGMRGLETEFVLEQVLEHEPRALRWVWIEPNDVAQRLDEENLESERFQAWHDLRHTWLALDLWWGGERPGYDAGEWAREHLQALARHLFGFGRGVSWLRAARNDSGDASAPDYDGFKALDASRSPRMERRHLDFLDKLHVFQEKIERVSRGLAEGETRIEPFERRFLLRLRRRVEAAGAQVIFFVPPLPHLRSQYPVQGAALGLVPVTFNYTDPERHPALYDPALHFDQTHLNGEGAILFTRLLADDFVRYTRPEGPLRRVAGGAQNWK